MNSPTENGFSYLTPPLSRETCFLSTYNKLYHEIPEMQEVIRYIIGEFIGERIGSVYAVEAG
jgi:hypothetical protein